jgi:hypothetical protein
MRRVERGVVSEVVRMLGEVNEEVVEVVRCGVVPADFSLVDREARQLRSGFLSTNVFDELLHVQE